MSVTATVDRAARTEADQAVYTEAVWLTAERSPDAPPVEQLQGIIFRAGKESLAEFDEDVDKATRLRQLAEDAKALAVTLRQRSEVQVELASLTAAIDEHRNVAWRALQETLKPLNDRQAKLQQRKSELETAERNEQEAGPLLFRETQEHVARLVKPVQAKIGDLNAEINKLDNVIARADGAQAVIDELTPKLRRLSLMAKVPFIGREHQKSIEDITARLEREQSKVDAAADAQLEKTELQNQIGKHNTEIARLRLRNTDPKIVPFFKYPNET